MRTIARSLILPVLVAGLLLVPTWALAQGTTIADPTNASQRAGVVPCASATNANGCVKVDGSFGGPMPVTMSTSTGVTSDIAAWGKQWLTSPGRTASGSDVAVFESDGTLTRIQVGNAGPQNGTIFRSFDRGRSWVNGGTTTGSPFGARVRGMRKLASTYMVAGEGGLTFSNDLTNWVAGTGLPGGTIIAVEVQGSTVVAQAVTGSQLCRSTNVPANVATGAPTFTCTAPVGMNTANESQALVSPGPLRWLFLDGGGGGTNRQVFLSTNDGVTFTLQATLSALGNTNGESALTCVSTTTCLAAAGLALYQTTDAGVTWTRVLSASGANEFVAFINFGQGVVVAGTRDMNASPTPFRTTDATSGAPSASGKASRRRSRSRARAFTFASAITSAPSMTSYSRARPRARPSTRAPASSSSAAPAPRARPPSPSSQSRASRVGRSCRSRAPSPFPLHRRTRGRRPPGPPGGRPSRSRRPRS